MRRVDGGLTLSPAEIEQLMGERRPDDITLFVIPYHVSAEVLGGDPKDFNEKMKKHLKRGIITQLQQMVSALAPPISITDMPIEIDVTDTARARDSGEALEALAVFGITEVDSAAGGEGIVEVSSEFLVIPSFADVQLGTMYVDDRLPLERLQSANLFSDLNREWGANTAVALALLYARKAIAPGGTERDLESAHDYLVAAKRELPQGHLLVAPIDGLLAQIDAKLPP
jgi:hypothetical protein